MSFSQYTNKKAEEALRILDSSENGISKDETKDRPRKYVFNINNLKKTLEKEAGFRYKQAKEAIFKSLVGNWSEVKNFPLLLRKTLNKECPISINTETFISKDKKSIKALITLEDGLKIESVLMRHNDGRNTVCVSSQVGCPLGCVFCATGEMGFKRSLEISEIVEQILFFARYLKKCNPLAKITNAVFMGMGEPFLNYDNVLGAIKVLNDKEGFDMGARRFSISTAGITEGIEKLAKEKLEINLAISLHAPDEELRSKIMPVNEKYPIEKILEAVDYYIKETHRKVMFEYLMIKDLNDTDECARRLSILVKNRLCMVNLISYNFTGVFKPSLSERIKKFKEILEKEKISVVERYRFGRGIKAACGQLATKSKKR